MKRKKGSMLISPPPGRGEYRVVWIIDVDGKNPREAASNAHSFMRQQIDPAFTVISHAGKKVDVDFAVSE